MNSAAGETFPKLSIAPIRAKGNVSPDLTIARRMGAAVHAHQAIEIAHRLQPDVILMDLSMPVVDGWQATRQLKADPLTKNIIIVAVTAHAFPGEHVAARVAGCDAVIPKPYDLTALADALDRVISKGLTALDPEAVALKAARRPPRRGSPAKSHTREQSNEASQRPCRQHGNYSRRHPTGPR